MAAAHGRIVMSGGIVTDFDPEAFTEQLHAMVDPTVPEPPSIIGMTVEAVHDDDPDRDTNGFHYPDAVRPARAMADEPPQFVFVTGQ